MLLDYAADVIKATDIRTSGAIGAIRYVGPPAGGAWMPGKPIQVPEARDLYQNGLKIVSCYQYGKQGTADWLGGQNAGVQHAVGASGTEKLPMSFVLQQTFCRSRRGWPSSRCPIVDS